MSQRIPAPVLHILVLVGLVFALYRPSLEFQFVWDDNLYVTGNPAVQDWSYAGKAFTSPRTTWSGDTQYTIAEWRPIRNLSYLLDHTIYGLNPIGWHLTNLILHAVAAALLYLLMRRLTDLTGGNSRAGLACLVAATLWALHPLQTEVVAWVKSRDDLLAAPLAFAALLCGLHKGRRSLAGAFVLYLLALLSKENALVLAGIYPMILIVLRPWGKAARLQSFLAIAMIVAGLAFLVVRQQVLGRTGQADHFGDTALQTMLTMFHAFARYIQLILWPWPPTVQSADYDSFPISTNLLDFGALAGLAILTAVIILAVAARRTFPIVTIGAGFFVLALMPFANIVPMMQVMAERFLYVPLAGIAITASAVRNRNAMMVLGIIAALLAWQTHRRLPVWESQRTLFEATVRENPTSWRPANNLITTLIADGETTEALNLANKAMIQWPADLDILRSAALAQMAVDNEEGATSITHAIMKIEPNDSRASDTLAAWRKMKDASRK